MKASPEQNQEHQHEREHADKAEHAASMRENEVRLANFEQSELALSSPFDAESPKSPGTDADAGLNQIESVAACIGFRIEKDGPASSLVFDQQELPDQENS